jgi:glycosyltransferase involved in cell wall biosynthesis
MHILFLSDNFPPEVNAPASRTFEHCREWVREGHQVTVVTCAPNFPTGKVFAGYRNRLWQSEEMDGIRVIRVWSYIAANAGFGRRILDYVSYMVTASLAALRVGNVSVVIGTSPQFFAACAAFFVGWVKRAPFVFELRDLWPESIKAVGAMRQPRLIAALDRLELLLYRRARLIVSVTNSFRRNLERRGIDPRKIEVVTNGVDLARYQPQPRDADLAAKLGLERKFVAGYIGTHGMAHALETILDCAGLAARDPAGRNIHFLMVGDGAEKARLREECRTRGLANVTFIDSVSKDQVVRYWSLLDVSIIHLRRTALFKSVIPSKMFESMAMGIPILLGVEGEASEILKAEHAGLPFEPENSALLCCRLMALKDDPQLRASLSRCGATAARNYDRTILARRMLRLLENL